MRLYAWWSGMPRQGRTGWTLVVFGTGYILYFLKARLFVAGPPITNKEWLVFVGMIALRESRRCCAPTRRPVWLPSYAAMARLAALLSDSH